MFVFSEISKPFLYLDKGNQFSEGEEVPATCTAPGERGSFFFTFYDGTREILDQISHSNQVQVKLLFKTAGSYNIHCTYTVRSLRDHATSEESNRVFVSVIGEFS